MDLHEDLLRSYRNDLETTTANHAAMRDFLDEIAAARQGRVDAPDTVNASSILSHIGEHVRSQGEVPIEFGRVGTISGYPIVMAIELDEEEELYDERLVLRMWIENARRVGEVEGFPSSFSEEHELLDSVPSMREGLDEIIADLPREARETEVRFAEVDARLTSLREEAGLLGLAAANFPGPAGNATKPSPGPTAPGAGPPPAPGLEPPDYGR